MGKVSDLFSKWLWEKFKKEAEIESDSVKHLKLFNSVNYGPLDPEEDFVTVKGNYSASAPKLLAEAFIKAEHIPEPWCVHVVLNAMVFHFSNAEDAAFAKLVL